MDYFERQTLRQLDFWLIVMGLCAVLLFLAFVSEVRPDQSPPAAVETRQCQGGVMLDRLPSGHA